MGKYHGSPKESHKIGSGGACTKELCVGGGPGKPAMKIKPDMARKNFEGGAGGKLPKTGKPYTKE